MPPKKQTSKEPEPITDDELEAKLNPPQEPESDHATIDDSAGKIEKSRYISNSLIACAITVHYGRYSVMLEKRIYSEAKSLAEQSAEYDKLELQLERHHAEWRTNHAPKFKPAGSR